jgi:translation elongation factor EF-1alpha
VLEERACLELFTNYKQLGRITIRDKSETIASGIIIELG